MFKDLNIPKKFPFPYKPEDFSKKEKEVLLNFFTNVDKPVFAIYNLPQEVVGAMFSRYSRSDKSIRRLFMDEFWDSSFSTYKLDKKRLSKATERTSAFYKKVYAEFGDDSVIQVGSVHIAFEFVSQVAVQTIEDQRIGASYIEKSTRYVNFGNKVGNHYLYSDVPEITKSKYAKEFKDWNNFAFDSYNKHLQTAIKFLSQKYPIEKFADVKGITDEEQLGKIQRAYERALKAKAFDTIRVFLPTTVITNLGAHYSGQAAENTINKLLSSPLSELRLLGKMAYEELFKVSPNFLQNINFHFGEIARRYRQEVKLLSQEVASKIADKIKSGEDTKDVQIVDFDRDTDVKIASQIIYANQTKTCLSKSQIFNWAKKNKKLLPKILLSAIPDRSKPEYNRRHKLPRAFEHAYAEVEFFKDFGIYRDLRRNRLSSTERLYLNPKNIEIPKEFEERGMEEVLKDYLKLHDLSNVLYNKLIKDKDISLKNAAEYITVLGHKLRFNIRANFRQWVFFSELRTIAGGHPSYRNAMQKAVKEILKKLPYTKPLFAKVDWVEDYGLGRMRSEVNTQEALSKIKKMKRGKFIVIYGPNNIGKTTQTKMIVKWLKKKGVNASYLKYPIYDLEPTGPRLDGILRHHTENLTALENQKIFAQNRRDYEPTLTSRLNSGEWIVAEDYKGTGIAWGMTFDVPKDVLERINHGLFDEDLAICMIGDRFSSGIEKGHLHEQSDCWDKDRKIHKQLSKEKGWIVVDANGSKEQVNGRIREAISKNIKI